jgi:hypothetical protein
MNYEGQSKAASIWEQRKGRFQGTALENGNLLNPEFYMHLLEGCAYNSGEIVGTPAFINTYKLFEPLRRDLAEHLSAHPSASLKALSDAI